MQQSLMQNAVQPPSDQQAFEQKIRRFQPSLNNCRIRKVEEIQRERAESLDSNDDEPSMFCMKNHDFYFGASELYPKKRDRSEYEESYTDDEEEQEFEAAFRAKNREFYFGASIDLTDDFNEFSIKAHSNRLIEEAINFANSQDGECLSEWCDTEDTPLTYKCKLGHVWESCDPLKLGIWCPECESILNDAKSLASFYGGILISEKIDYNIIFECSNKHRWRADVSKFSMQDWCSQCPRMNRAEKKRYREQFRQKMTQELMHEQQQMFRKALLDMKKNIIRIDPNIIQHENQGIENRARELVKNCINSGTTAFTEEQAFLVYKVLLSPQQLIIDSYFSEQSTEIAHKRYRDLIKALHPDKNLHPSSNEAFKKICAAYEAATRTNRQFIGNNRVQTP